MEIKDFLNNLVPVTSYNQNKNAASFKNLQTGEDLKNNDMLPSKNFLIECISYEEKFRANLGHVVPPAMRAAAQNRSSTSNSGGIRAFGDAEINDFNELAASSTDSPVKKIVRKSADYLLFVLRNPVHWKRIYAALDDSSHDQLFDCVFDGPKGIKIEREHTLRSIGIQISTKSSAKLEDMIFRAYAFYDEDGNYYQKHPNVCYDNGKICLGSLEGSARLGKVRISDLITLMEGVNMTSAYSTNRGFHNNEGESFEFRPYSSMYARKEMFTKHVYLG